MKKPSLWRKIKQSISAARSTWTLTSDEAINAFGSGSGGRMLMDWAVSSMHPDDAVRMSADRLRAKSRDLAESNGYIKQFLRMLETNVVGPKGATLNCQIKSAKNLPLTTANDTIEKAWRSWGARPVTTDGRYGFVALQQLLVKSLARDGEVFVRFWRDFEGNESRFALEPIDPELVDIEFNRMPGRDGAEVRMGIEVDRFGRPLAYHVWNRLDRTLPSTQRYRMRVPADEIVHLCIPERIGQIRCVTWFRPALVPTKLLGGYVQAELVAARLGAAKVGIFTNPEGLGGGDPTGDNGTTSGSKAPTTMMDAGPGSALIAPPYYQFQAWDPTHPNGAFGDFVKSILREIATGLGVTYNGLANDLEGVNFSSMRSGLLGERDLWRVLQAWWSTTLLQRVYEEWLNIALVSGELAVGSRDFRKYRDVTWTARGWTWVDPQKDVQAGVLGLKHGLTSRTMLLDEQGVDFETVLEQLAIENTLADEKGVEIMDKTPTPVIADNTANADATNNADSANTNGKAKSKKNDGRGWRNRVNGHEATGLRPETMPVATAPVPLED